MKVNFNRLTDKNLREKIVSVFATAIDMLNIKSNISVNITIVGEKKIRELNKQFREVDRVTDVLSFPLNEGDDFNSKEFKDENIFTDIGDIVICLKRAKQQAYEYGHGLEREICFLSLHGFLHLLGYDHIQKSDEEIMFSLQKQILERNNIGR